jgi:uncharacterized protein
MKFHLAQAEGNRFVGYGEGWVQVNATRHASSLVVLPDRLVEGWAPAGFDGLAVEDFRALLEHAPEIVLLGTGRTLRFPDPRLAAPLAERRIGLEVMDTPAACRTFNILSAEGRRVAAAVLVEAARR